MFSSSSFITIRFLFLSNFDSIVGPIIAAPVPPPPPPPAPQRLPANACAPSFISPIKDAGLLEGRNIAFECRARGQPAPTATWFQDGIPVTEDSRHRIFHNEATGEMSLFITMAQPTDVGEYTCVLRNPLGETSMTALLLPEAEYQRRLANEQARKEKEQRDLTKRSVVSELEDRFKRPPVRSASTEDGHEPDWAQASFSMTPDEFQV